MSLEIGIMFSLEKYLGGNFEEIIKNETLNVFINQMKEASFLMHVT